MLSNNVHLVACHQKSADTLWIVSDDSFTYVVPIAAIAIWISTKASNSDCAVQVRLSIRIFFNEAIDLAFISPLSNSQIGLRQVTVTNSLRQGVDKHARSRGFKEVSLFCRLVHHLVPESGLGILIPGYRLS